MLIELELARIASAFERASIPLLVLKGVPLARLSFGRLDAREIRDNDLLVRRRDVRRAHAVLDRLGYRSRPRASLEDELRDPFFFQHVMVCPTPNGPAVAELHWHAFPPALYPCPEGLVWACSEAGRVSDAPIRVFDPEMTAVHLASHWAQHRFGEPRILADFAATLARRKPDLDRVAQLARVVGLADTVEHALQTAARFGWIEPRVGRSNSWKLRIARAGTAASTDLQRYDHGESYLAIVAPLVLAPPGAGRRYLRWQLAPPASYLASKYGTPTHWTSYLRRPLQPLHLALRDRIEALRRP